MKRIFFDTSAIYSYINRKDPDHARVKEIVRKRKTGLVLTNYIFDEVVTLVQARLGHSTAVAAGEILMHAHELEHVFITRQDEVDAWSLFAERPDKEYSFTDCTSFVIMRRMNITSALALDEHFMREGFKMLV